MCIIITPELRTHLVFEAKPLLVGMVARSVSSGHYIFAPLTGNEEGSTELRVLLWTLCTSLHSGWGGRDAYIFVWPITRIAVQYKILPGNL